MDTFRQALGHIDWEQLYPTAGQIEVDDYLHLLDFVEDIANSEDVEANKEVDEPLVNMLVAGFKRLIREEAWENPSSTNEKVLQCKNILVNLKSRIESGTRGEIGAVQTVLNSRDSC